MGNKHRVHFEPVDLEIEVDEDETVLDAAFRQGIGLMHGCREGQCSACKSFLLDGDLQMDRYSTFALADYEAEEGYVLLCRGHAYSDLDVELINYDEDNLRNAKPIKDVRTEVAALTDLTHDISLLRLKLLEPTELDFNAGQYVDITIPGTDRHRSFSMATTPSAGDELAFIIKRYPDGHFSGLLEDKIKAGDELAIRGPFGAFTLREHSDRDLVFIGGGAGMAPILSVLRHMAEEGIERRAVYYYGARTPKDLFYLDELAELSSRLTDFEFVPCLSEEWPDDWDEIGIPGEQGMVTEVVERRETDLAEKDAYLCGPPPMIDAAIPVLEAQGVPHDRIYYDKFTSTADPEKE
jgi:propane monooxygenase reductase subunit